MARVTEAMVREYQLLTNALFNAVAKTILDAFKPSQMRNPAARQEIVKKSLDYFTYFGRSSSDLGRAWYQQCRDVESDGTTTYVAREYFDDNLYRKLTRDINEILDKAQAAEEEASESEKPKAEPKPKEEPKPKQAEKEEPKPTEDEEDTIEELGLETEEEVIPEEAPTIDEEALDKLADRIANYVLKVNRDTVMENLNIENEGVESAPGTPTRVEQRRELRRMPKGRVAYMRVPSAGCTCAFCIMMASRGAVYKTRESAGGGDVANRYHLHCRCSVVPVSVNDTTIEGYSTEEFQDQYYGAREVWEDKSYSDDVAKRIAQAKARAIEKGNPWRDINEIEIVMRDMYELT